MAFEERHQRLALILGLLAFIGYWAVVLVRAATDGLAFTQVAWQGPMLVAVLVGGGAYGVVYGVMRWRVRGTRVTDERDVEIGLHAETAGATVTSLAVLVTIILLALDAPSFWVAHVLFVGSYLGSVTGAMVSLAAYREGAAA